MKMLTKEVSLGKVHPGFVEESLAVSPDSRRVAYVTAQHGKFSVMVDGEASKEYDAIGKGEPLFQSR